MNRFIVVLLGAVTHTPHSIGKGEEPDQELSQRPK